MPIRGYGSRPSPGRQVMHKRKTAPPRGGAIFLCRPSVMVIALLDHHDAVAMMAPAAMPATIVVVHLGTCTIPAVMMAAALDDDGLGTGNRRRGDRDRGDSAQHIRKLLHDVSSSRCKMRTAAAQERSAGIAGVF